MLISPLMRGLPRNWTIETVDSVPHLKSLAPEWDDLFFRAKASLPFLTAAWSISWWKHLAKEDFTARDGLRVFAVRDGEDLVAVAPMILTEHPGVGPFRIRVLQFLGPDWNITELRGILCHSDYEGRVVAALAESFAGGGDFDWIQWGGLRQGGGGEAALAGAHVTWTRDSSVPVLTIPESWEAFRAGLKRNIRKSLRKCDNSLRRDGHVPRVGGCANPK